LSVEAQPGLGNSQSSLGAMDGPKTVHQMYSTLVLKEFSRLVTTDPEELRPKPYDFPWELVICVAIIGLFSVLLIFVEKFSIRSKPTLRKKRKTSCCEAFWTN
jgi:hypothetical protein